MPVYYRDIRDDIDNGNIWSLESEQERLDVIDEWEKYFSEREGQDGVPKDIRSIANSARRTLKHDSLSESMAKKYSLSQTNMGSDIIYPDRKNHKNFLAYLESVEKGERVPDPRVARANKFLGKETPNELTPSQGARARAKEEQLGALEGLKISDVNTVLNLSPYQDEDGVINQFDVSDDDELTSESFQKVLDLSTPEQARSMYKNLFLNMYRRDPSLNRNRFGVGVDKMKVRLDNMFSSIGTGIADIGKPDEEKAISGAESVNKAIKDRQSLNESRIDYSQFTATMNLDDALENVDADANIVSRTLQTIYQGGKGIAGDTLSGDFSTLRGSVNLSAEQLGSNLDSLASFAVGGGGTVAVKALKIPLSRMAVTFASSGLADGVETYYEALGEAIDRAGSDIDINDPESLSKLFLDPQYKEVYEDAKSTAVRRGIAVGTFAALGSYSSTFSGGLASKGFKGKFDIVDDVDGLKRVDVARKPSKIRGVAGVVAGSTIDSGIEVGGEFVAQSFSGQETDALSAFLEANPGQSSIENVWATGEALRTDKSMGEAMEIVKLMNENNIKPRDIKLDDPPSSDGGGGGNDAVDITGDVDAGESPQPKATQPEVSNPDDGEDIDIGQGKTFRRLKSADKYVDSLYDDNNPIDQANKGVLKSQVLFIKKVVGEGLGLDIVFGRSDDVNGVTSDLGTGDGTIYINIDSAFRNIQDPEKNGLNLADIVGEEIAHRVIGDKALEDMFDNVLMKSESPDANATFQAEYEKNLQDYGAGLDPKSASKLAKVETAAKFIGVALQDARTFRRLKKNNPKAFVRVVKAMGQVADATTTVGKEIFGESKNKAWLSMVNDLDAALDIASSVASNKPVSKPATKSEVKPKAKPESKAETKPETKAEVKPDAQPDAQPEDVSQDIDSEADTDYTEYLDEEAYESRDDDVLNEDDLSEDELDLFYDGPVLAGDDDFNYTSEEASAVDELRPISDTDVDISSKPISKPVEQVGADQTADVDAPAPSTYTKEKAGSYKFSDEARSRSGSIVKNKSKWDVVNDEGNVVQSLRSLKGAKEWLDSDIDDETFRPLKVEEPEVKADPEPEPKSKPEVKAKPEAKVEPEAKANPEVKVETEDNRNEAKVEPEAKDANQPADDNAQQELALDDERVEVATSEESLSQPAEPVQSTDIQPELPIQAEPLESDIVQHSGEVETSEIETIGEPASLNLSDIAGAKTEEFEGVTRNVSDLVRDEDTGEVIAMPKPVVGNLPTYRTKSMSGPLGQGVVLHFDGDSDAVSDLNYVGGDAQLKSAYQDETEITVDDVFEERSSEDSESARSLSTYLSEVKMMISNVKANAGVMVSNAIISNTISAITRKQQLTARELAALKSALSDQSDLFRAIKKDINEVDHSEIKSAVSALEDGIEDANWSLVEDSSDGTRTNKRLKPNEISYINTVIDSINDTAVQMAAEDSLRSYKSIAESLRKALPIIRDLDVAKAYMDSFTKSVDIFDLKSAMNDKGDARELLLDFATYVDTESNATDAEASMVKQFIQSLNIIYELNDESITGEISSNIYSKIAEIQQSFAEAMSDPVKLDILSMGSLNNTDSESVTTPTKAIAEYTKLINEIFRPLKELKEISDIAAKQEKTASSLNSNNNVSERHDLLLKKVQSGEDNSGNYVEKSSVDTSYVMPVIFRPLKIKLSEVNGFAKKMAKKYGIEMDGDYSRTGPASSQGKRRNVTDDLFAIRYRESVKERAKTDKGTFDTDNEMASGTADSDKLAEAVTKALINDGYDSVVVVNSNGDVHAVNVLDMNKVKLDDMTMDKNGDPIPVAERIDLEKSWRYSLMEPTPDVTDADYQAHLNEPEYRYSLMDRVVTATSGITPNATNGIFGANGVVNAISVAVQNAIANEDVDLLRAEHEVAREAAGNLVENGRSLRLRINPFYVKNTAKTLISQAVSVIDNYYNDTRRTIADAGITLQHMNMYAHAYGAPEKNFRWSTAGMVQFIDGVENDPDLNRDEKDHLIQQARERNRNRRRSERIALRQGRNVSPALMSNGRAEGVMEMIRYTYTDEQIQVMERIRKELVERNRMVLMSKMDNGEITAMQYRHYSVFDNFLTYADTDIKMELIDGDRYSGQAFRGLKGDGSFTLARGGNRDVNILSASQYMEKKSVVASSEVEIGRAFIRLRDFAGGEEDGQRIPNHIGRHVEELTLNQVAQERRESGATDASPDILIIRDENAVDRYFRGSTDHGRRIVKSLRHNPEHTNSFLEMAFKYVFSVPSKMFKVGMTRLSAGFSAVQMVRDIQEGNIRFNQLMIENFGSDATSLSREGFNRNVARGMNLAEHARQFGVLEGRRGDTVRSDDAGVTPAMRHRYGAGAINQAPIFSHEAPPTTDESGSPNVWQPIAALTGRETGGQLRWDSDKGRWVPNGISAVEAWRKGAFMSWKSDRITVTDLNARNEQYGIHTGDQNNQFVRFRTLMNRRAMWARDVAHEVHESTAGQFADAYVFNIENAVRAALMLSMIDSDVEHSDGMGVGIDDTLKISRDFFNFEERGKYHKYFEGLFPFFGSAVKGNINTIRAFRPSNSRDSYANAYTATMAFTAMGFMAGMMTLGSEEDEENDEDSVRAKRYRADVMASNPDIAMIPTGATSSIKIPLTHGYRASFAMGRFMAGMASGSYNEERKGEEFMQVISNGLNEFNPIDFNTSSRSVMPTVLRPLLSENSSYGTPYDFQSYGDETAKWMNYNERNSKNRTAKALSKKVLDTTGLNMSPSRISEYVGWAGDIPRIMYLMGDIASFDGADPSNPVSSKDLPIARKIYDNNVYDHNMSAFYRLRAGKNEFDRKVAEAFDYNIKLHEKTGNKKSLRLASQSKEKFLRENKDLVKFLDEVDTEGKKISELSKEIEKAKLRYEGDKLNSRVQRASDKQVEIIDKLRSKYEKSSGTYAIPKDFTDYATKNL